MSCDLTNIDKRYSDIDSLLGAKDNDMSIVTGFNAINNSINNILTIKSYEIPSQPQEFINLYDYLHEIADEITFESIRIEVKDILALYETRIEVIEVQIKDFVIDNYIVLTVIYKLRKSVNNEIQQTDVTIRG